MSEVICRDEQRREKVLQRPELNGLDYLEVGGLDDPENQQILRVYCFGKVPADLNLDETNIIIEGGRRITDIKVEEVKLCQDQEADDDYLEVEVDKPGDFSTYTLRVVQPTQQQGEQDKDGKSCLNPKCPQSSKPTNPSLDVRQCKQPKEQEEKTEDQADWIPHPGFDQRYNSLEFSFKATCSDELDDGQTASCPSEPLEEPDINYLAKDYASFRQLILDRLSLIMPDWQERHVPDLGMTLVELLAYTGDHLSYYQDAVATEAYLDTARQRISVRRHARLVDYTMHEGCNARAWVHVEVGEGGVFEHSPEDFYFITGMNGVSTVLTQDDLRQQQVQASQYEVFEPLVYDDIDKDSAPDTCKEQKICFRSGHNRIDFYTWDDQECCLPRGATSATLCDGLLSTGNSTPKDKPDQSQQQSKQNQYPVEPEEPERLLKLEKGDVLLFEEIQGTETGQTADADPRHRHVVRLTEVRKDVDRLTNTPILEISWAEEDALPFPLCISSLGQAPKCEMIHNVSVARGNTILVDHGRNVEIEQLDPVPVKKGGKEYCIEQGRPAAATAPAGYYRPSLKETPLTFSQPVSLSEEAVKPSASAMLIQDLRQALPKIELIGIQKTAEPPAQEESPGNPAEQEKVDLSDKAKNQDDCLKKPGTDPDQSDCPDSDKEEKSAWLPQADLLASGPDDRHFVVEMDNDGRAHLRFGNNEFGEEPEVGMLFQAKYRIGNGPAGNVGAEAISHLVLRNGPASQGNVQAVRNPMPAQGGTMAEPMAEAKLFAPRAFLKEQQRAVTAADYAALVEREFKTKVQRAAARLRWNGSWNEVLVAVDPLGQDVADQELLDAIKDRLYRYRRIGHDLKVISARLVPLDIAMTIRVLPNYLRGHVRPVLLDLFSDRLLADGSRGFFHPDNLSFGDGVHLSCLNAAAQGVTGVESVQVTKLERLNIPSEKAIDDGVLPIGPFEIARLDNDPSFPENGILKLKMEGGRR